ncbi:hypothetical protein HN935_00430 [archaeon]|nr:hypothetical protein [archaeon]
MPICIALPRAWHLAIVRLALDPVLLRNETCSRRTWLQSSFLTTSSAIVWMSGAW